MKYLQLKFDQKLNCPSSNARCEGASQGFPPDGGNMTTFTSNMCSHLPDLYTSSPPPTAGANGRSIVLCDTRPNHALCHRHAHHVIVHLIPGILYE